MPTREEILANARHGKPEPLDVPEFYPDLYIRILSAKDQLALSEGVDPKDLPFRVIVACICDAEGEAYLQPGDEAVLQEFPFPVIMRVFAKVAKLNGLSSRELEDAMASFEDPQGGVTSSG